MTPERLALIEQCLDDGWPFSEIVETYGVSHGTLKKYFPGRQMPKQEASSLGLAIGKANGKQAK
jgi:hypothetical protein